MASLSSDRQAKLDQQIAEFLARGGKILQVPVGVSGEMVKLGVLPWHKPRELGGKSY